MQAPHSPRAVGRFHLTAKNSEDAMGENKVTKSFHFIPLTRAQFAIVDDSDFELLNQFRWHAKGDVRGGKFYAACNQRHSKTGRFRMIDEAAVIARDSFLRNLKESGERHDG
jgi:hypothetical protein